MPWLRKLHLAGEMKLGCSLLLGEGGWALHAKRHC
jgi:hypothetical protein